MNRGGGGQDNMNTIIVACWRYTVLFSIIRLNISSCSRQSRYLFDIGVQHGFRNESPNKSKAKRVTSGPSGVGESAGVRSAGDVCYGNIRTVDTCREGQYPR